MAGFECYLFLIWTLVVGALGEPVANRPTDSGQVKRPNYVFTHQVSCIGVAFATPFCDECCRMNLKRPRKLLFNRCGCKRPTQGSQNLQSPR